MHFGKNLKLVTVLEYENKNFTVVKHTFVDKKNKDVLSKKQYFYKDDIEPKYDKDIMIVDTIVTGLELDPNTVYSNGSLREMLTISRINEKEDEAKKR